jgi:hypothetical protein
MAGLERRGLRTEARLGIPHGAMRGLPRACAGSGSPLAVELTRPGADTPLAGRHDLGRGSG